jgi:hypothetical protein
MHFSSLPSNKTLVCDIILEHAMASSFHVISNSLFIAILLFDAV